MLGRTRRTVRRAPLGGFLVGPLARGGVRWRVALHDELPAARGAALLQHAVLRAARAHGVARHGQARDRVVRAAAAARRSLRTALLRTSTHPFSSSPLDGYSYDIYWITTHDMVKDKRNNIYF